MGALRRRPVMIVLLAMVLAAAAVTISYFFVAPEYVVESRLILNPSTPHIMFPDADLTSAPGGRGYRDFQHTQFLQIKSRDVLFDALAVLQDLADNRDARQAEAEAVARKKRLNPQYVYTTAEADLLERLQLIEDIPPDVLKRLGWLFESPSMPLPRSILPIGSKGFSVEAVQNDERFRVTPVPNSYAMSIQYAVKGDPHRVEKDRELLEALPCFINAVVYAYQKQYRQILHRTALNTLAVLESEQARFETQRDEVRDQLKRKTDEVDAETRGMNQNRFEALAIENEKALNAFVQMMIEAEIDLRAARDELARVQEKVPETMVRAYVDSDEGVLRMARQLEDRENLLKVLKTQFSDAYAEKNPQIVRLTAEVETLRKRLDELKAAARKEAVEPIIEQRKLVVQQMESRLELLKHHRDRTLAEKQKNLDQAKALYRKAESQRVEINDLEDSLREIKTTLSMIRQRVRAIQVEQKAQPTLQIHSLARTPEQPSVDKRKQAMLGGCFLALALAVGFAVLLDMRDHRVTTARDVETHVQAATLGVVHRITGRRSGDPRRACIDRADSLGAEQYRAVASALMVPHEGKAIRTVMVTSPGKGDGKSTISCNLAAALAQSGERVLLIDANLVNPDLSRSFKLDGSRGLSDVVAGCCELTEAIQSTEQANLDILVAGESTDRFETNPLGHPQGQQLLDKVKQDYRFVLIDTPPILLTADASTVGSRVDGVVCAVRSGLRNRGEVRRAVQRIVRTGAAFLGVVLNGARPIRGGYYSELNQDYSAYHRDTGKKAKDTAAS